MQLFFSVVMSAEELLHEGESEPTDGEMYEMSGDDAGDGGQPSWSSLTVAALKAALVERGLQTTGRKADLVARLEASQSCMLICHLCMVFAHFYYFYHCQLQFIILLFDVLFG